MFTETTVKPAFIRATPGHACKLAVVTGAEWTRQGLIDEAILLTGTTVAYRDATGWFINAGWLGLDVRGVSA